MAYKKKTKEEVAERNLRAAHTNFPVSDTRFDTMLHESLLIYDQALYFLRWEYFSCRDCEFLRLPEYPSWFDLCAMVQKTSAWKESKLDINVKKQAVKEARDAWTTYSSAKFDYMQNPEKYSGVPEIPRYLYRRMHYHDLVIDKTRFRGNNLDAIRIPCTDIDITVPKSIKKEWIIEVNIKKVNSHPKVSFVYDYDMRVAYENEQRELEGKLHSSAVRTDIKKEDNDKNKKPKRILSLDLGKVNLVTGMTFGCGKDDMSFIIRGCFFQNKINETCSEIARLQSAALTSKNKEVTGISQKDGTLKLFSNTKAMTKIWTSYNNFTDNQVGNISEMIIDFCVEHEIDMIIVGYNDGWKQEIELGKKNNRVFCHIPHKRLIETLEYKAKEKSIEMMTVEESYTSKCDHFALEDMCHHEKYLGKRVHRGLFKSSTGKIVNADVNGCIGMIRKAKLIPDADLIGGLRNRGDVVDPVVLNVRGFHPHKQRSSK